MMYFSKVGAATNLQQRTPCTFSPETLTINFLEDANLSTFLREAAHLSLKVYTDPASGL